MSGLSLAMLNTTLGLHSIQLLHVATQTPFLHVTCYYHHRALLLLALDTLGLSKQHARSKGGWGGGEGGLGVA